MTTWKLPALPALALALAALAQSQPAGPAAARILANYDRTLNQLSEPVAARWQHFGNPYFSSNEKLLNLFYPAFDNLGGVIVGVSFQQNLSLLVHARPEACVIFDINPGVTEILVPFFGALMVESPTRRQLLSKLLGADVSAKDAIRLLEGTEPALVIAEILQRGKVEERKLRIEGLTETLRAAILARLPAIVSPAVRAQALRWIEIMEEEEFRTAVFFQDAVAPRILSNSPAAQVRLAGWLSTESNYQLVRRYWMEGRIVGVTGDIGGTSVAKLAQWIGAAPMLRQRRVTGIYLSNVGVSLEGHLPQQWFRDLYASLAKLPVAPHAMTLIAHGPWQLTAFARTFDRARWVYESLADVPDQLAIQLHEAPLEMLTQMGPAALVPALRKGLLVVGAEGGAQQCVAVIGRLEADPAAVQFFDPERFGAWAKSVNGNLDARSTAFKTIVVTLVEAGFLQAPARN